MDERFHRLYRTLELELPGWVRVWGIREILRTLDRKGCKRGMTFEPNMFQYCGKFRVLFRVELIIGDATGQWLEIRNPVLLNSVRCCGKSFCHRGDSVDWRETWQQRCQPETSTESAH